MSVYHFKLTFSKNAFCLYSRGFMCVGGWERGLQWCSMTLTSCKHNYLRGIYSVCTTNAAHFYVRGCAGPAGLACGRLCCEYLSDAIKMKHVFELGPANHYDYIYTPND